MEFSVLSNNLKMPMMGFGVFQVTDKDVCKQSVLNAIRTGYRLIDTAAVLKWFTEFGHLNRGDMLTSEQHRCHNE
ncbi:hypothetical protein LP646_14510, partial [Escherichia coli]|nr:hypothetical protein [Escherichia coli]MCM2815444.1 hypothetical protein [Escherichia coli]